MDFWMKYDEKEYLTDLENIRTFGEWLFQHPTRRCSRSLPHSLSVPSLVTSPGCWPCPRLAPPHSPSASLLLFTTTHIFRCPCRLETVGPQTPASDRGRHSKRHQQRTAYEASYPRRGCMGMASLIHGAACEPLAFDYPG
jgi:hypothetical protein